jgi:hypothetical protein
LLPRQGPTKVPHHSCVDVEGLADRSQAFVKVLRDHPSSHSNVGSCTLDRGPAISILIRATVPLLRPASFATRLIPSPFPSASFARATAVGSFNGRPRLFPLATARLAPRVSAPAACSARTPQTRRTSVASTSRPGVDRLLVKIVIDPASLQALDGVEQIDQ